MKKGFTLPEILITVTILGVVASLTIPVLVSNYKSRSTALMLRKFYSNMKFAVEMYKKDERRDTLANVELSDGFFGENLSTYMKTNTITDINDSYKKAVMKDASCFTYKRISNNEIVFYYAPNVIDCTNPQNGNNQNFVPADGKKVFRFTLDTSGPGEPVGFVSSTKDDANSSRASLVTECQSNKNSCTKLIELDGWRVMKDYPYKF